MHRLPRAVTALVLGGLLLTGCSEPTPAQTPEAPTPAATPTPSATPVDTPAPEPEVDAYELPDCENLLIRDQVAEWSDPEVEPYTGDTYDYTGAEWLPGPVANRTFEQTTDHVSCFWAVPYSEGTAHVVVTLAPDPALDDLVAALAVSDMYEHTVRGDIDTYGTFITDGYGYGLGYAFADGIWAIARGTLLDETSGANLAADAVESVLLAAR